MKAIRKSRDERYMSPLELATDFRRYLAGQKLSAGPEDFVGAFGIRLVHEPVPPGARPAEPTAASGSRAPGSRA